MASVTGWASASHSRAEAKSAWPPSRSATLVSRLATGAVPAIPLRGGQHLVEERLVGDDPGDQPDPVGLLGVDRRAR